MQSKMFLVGLIVLVVVAGAVFWVNRGVPSVPTNTVPVVSSAPSQEITVIGGEYSYSPGSVSLNAGETVKITFKNTGNLPHNLMITELNVATKTIVGGQEDSVTVTAPTAGEYKFFCSVGNHRQLGMEGTLMVK